VAWSRKVRCSAGLTCFQKVAEVMASRLVLQRQRHLKWRALDALETMLMVLCGLCLLGFSTTVTFDIITRTIGAPWLWLQEVTGTFFIYGIFTGTAVATRRNDHLYLTAVADALNGAPRTVVEILIRLVVLGVGLSLVYFGYLNFLRGFTSFRMPSLTPIASLYAAIPLAGLLIALFAIEQLVNGCVNGFEGGDDASITHPEAIGGMPPGERP
jgi:TRAP-type C4-dicarboxylate transport system permease small subunit